MPAIINSDDGVVSGSSGLKTSGANDGITVFQQNGTESMRIDASGNITVKDRIQFGTDPQTNIQAGGTNDVDLIVAGDTNIRFETATNERMRIDSSGNVGIGTSSPGERLDVQSSSSPTIKVRNTANGIGNYSQIYFDVANSFSGTSASFVRSISLNAGNSSTALAFGTNADGGGAPAERARIDSSGNLLVGTTSGNAGIQSKPNSGNCFTTIDHITGTASGEKYTWFFYNGSSIGSITQNGTTAVAYNTSSDYRLKENIAPMTGALATVSQLKPVTYKWKADGSDGEGFIAHELAEVCPQAVTGEKDAVDADGNPVYQGIDTSFLVATLTAAIQELKAELDATKAEVAALKAAAK